MKLALRNSLFVLFTFMGMQLIAQPINDDCANALPVIMAADEASAVLTPGDTRSATASTTPAAVCSGSWFADDIWFSITTGDVLPETGVVIKAYFDQNVTATDVPAVGMAFYNSCDMDEAALQCFSSDDPANNQLVVGTSCLSPNSTFYVRVWSGGSPADFSGTLALGAFSHRLDETPLWIETFADSLDGWNTFGTCGNPDSNGNAVWRFLPDAHIDKGSFITDAAIGSLSQCDGAVGVDSDYDDNFGNALDENGNVVNEAFGTGPCPANQQYILESPALGTDQFDVAGLSLKFTQALRQFQSTYFVSFRNKNAGDPAWGDWNDFEINQDYVVNGGFSPADDVRLFMPGALSGDSLQIRFVYNANYYMWAIDDVQFVETEAHNLRINSNFVARAPWISAPADQMFDFPILADVYNAGAKEQSNVTLNHRLEDESGNTVSDLTLMYGSVAADSLAQNKAFPSLVPAPTALGNYTGFYTLTADSSDFDPSDNVASYSFNVNNTNEIAYENGPTNSFAVPTGSFSEGAPLSTGWGNYFYLPNGDDYKLNSITWGCGNPDDMAGLPVNIVLYEWNDNNGNQIVEFDERLLLGFSTYTFIGDEGANAIFQSELENFDDPGAPINLKSNTSYLSMVEYNAIDQTQMFFSANDEIDYSASLFAMDSAFIRGEVDHRQYVNVLAFSPDGNIAGADFEIVEFGDDGRTFFGNDFALTNRLNLESSVGTEDILPTDNLIEVYPNPARDDINISMDLVKSFDEVFVKILDATGKQVYFTTFNNVQKQAKNIDISGFANGAYMLQVITEDGYRTQQFVVQK